jgi:hypothetical protein
MLEKENVEKVRKLMEDSPIQTEGRMCYDPETDTMYIFKNGKWVVSDGRRKT